MNISIATPAAATTPTDSTRFTILGATAAAAAAGPVSAQRVAWSVVILLALIFSKYFYLASITSYYSFYLIDKFHLSIQSAQLYLCGYLPLLGVIAAFLPDLERS